MWKAVVIDRTKIDNEKFIFKVDKRPAVWNIPDVHGKREMNKQALNRLIISMYVYLRF